MNQRSGNRVPAVDTTRGIVIVLMILEHTRQILTGVVLRETAGYTLPPVTVSEALIRSFSHLCAPGFFLLLGLCAVLSYQREAHKGHSYGHFLRRGFLLICLQLTLVNLGWALSILAHRPKGSSESGFLYLGVLFSLGCVVIVMPLILRLPAAVIGVAGITCAIAPIVFQHIDFPVFAGGLLATGYRDRLWDIAYPLLPWTGVAFLGVAIGRSALDETGGVSIRVLRGWTLCLAGGSTAYALSAHQGWLVPEPATFIKYPPSIPFLLYTVTVVMLLLTLFQSRTSWNLPWLRQLGRHPLGIYVTHLYVIGILSLVPGVNGGLVSIFFTAAGVILLMAWGSRAFEQRHAYGRSLLGLGFDHYSPIYDFFMRLFSLYSPDEIRRELVSSGGGRLLDVGGGTGYIANRLQNDFEQTVVFDQSRGMLEHAKRRGLKSCLGSALQMPFAAASFEAITCTDALHHIKAFHVAIPEMARVLRTGGTIVIIEFHIKGFRGWLLKTFERLWIDDSRFIAPVNLQTLMASYGFTGEYRALSGLIYIYRGTKQ